MNRKSYLQSEQVISYFVFNNDYYYTTDIDFLEVVSKMI